MFSSSSTFSLSIDNEGGAWIFGKKTGRNKLPQPKFAIQVACKDLYLGFILDDDGKVWEIDIRLIPLTVRELPNLQNITQISCGFKNVACLNSSGRVYTFGNNTYGQLGLGITTLFVPDPTLVKDVENIIYIDCGRDFCCLLREDGKILFCGDNVKGQFGFGHFRSLWKFEVNEVFTESISSFSCGFSHILVLDSKGDLYSFGENNGGQLGLGHTQSKFLPQKIEFNKNIDSFFCSSYCSFILSNGDVWACGSNHNGNIGLPVDKIKITEFTKLTNIENVCNIYSGYYTILQTFDKYYFIGSCALSCGLDENLRNNNMIELTEEYNRIMNTNYIYSKVKSARK